MTESQFPTVVPSSLNNALKKKLQQIIYTHIYTYIYVKRVKMAYSVYTCTFILYILIFYIVNIFQCMIKYAILSVQFSSINFIHNVAPPSPPLISKPFP